MSKSRKLLLLLFLFALSCHTAVIEVNSTSPPAKPNATTGANTTTPVAKPVIQPVFILLQPPPEYTNIFSIGSGFQLPYLQTLAGFYYPRATYYTGPPATLWIGKPKNTSNETAKKNETLGGNGTASVNMSGAVVNGTKDGVKEEGKGLLDLGKNGTEMAKKQNVKEDGQKGADAKTVEPIKPVIQIDEKNDAEKNQKSTNSSTGDIKSSGVQETKPEIQVQTKDVAKTQGEIKIDTPKPEPIVLKPTVEKVEQIKDAPKIANPPPIVEAVKVQSTTVLEKSIEGDKNPETTHIITSTQTHSQTTKTQTKTQAIPVSNLRTQKPADPPAVAEPPLPAEPIKSTPQEPKP